MICFYLRWEAEQVLMQLSFRIFLMWGSHFQGWVHRWWRWLNSSDQLLVSFRLLVIACELNTVKVRFLHEKSIGECLILSVDSLGFFLAPSAVQAEPWHWLVEERRWVVLAQAVTLHLWGTPALLCAVLLIGYCWQMDRVFSLNYLDQFAEKYLVFPHYLSVFRFVFWLVLLFVSGPSFHDLLHDDSGFLFVRHWVKLVWFNPISDRR